ncbi:replication initiation protein [Tortoise microvirus 34]|nr:replication initiation protein [Tortoise microvirus 34]
MICCNPIAVKVDGEYQEVPCGKCVVCCRNRALNWTERILLEARYVGFENCCFLTLTYDDSELEKRGEVLKLDKSHVQKYMKRLRKRFSHAGKRIRYYLCGEYGAETSRPHYHQVLFCLSCDDVVGDCVSGCGVSKVEGLRGRAFAWPVWGYGRVHVASFTEGVAFYVAQYLSKSTPLRKEMLEKMGLPPEFSLMSRRPGLGFFELEKKREYYRRRPVRGWSSIEAVKSFPRHSRYIEEKLYGEGDAISVAFEEFKMEQKKNRVLKEKKLAEQRGICYRDYQLERRIQDYYDVVSASKNR